MTREDVLQLKAAAAALPPFAKIGLFSPLREAESRIFPHAARLPRWRWNLNKPGRYTYDLLVACNVFMYAPAPARWMRHVLAQCGYFLLLDLVRRQRGPAGEFGQDGDQTRFTVGVHQARVAEAFDLATLGNRLLAWHVYPGGANTFDPDPLHVIALIRGDRSAPLLRIDDYPTGVRPILPDLEPLHDILREIDTYGVPFHLGIVPALLTDEQADFLRSLQNLVPVVHGYDHAYSRFAPVLEAKGDPYNEYGSLGTFNEFAGIDEATITERLRAGRARLEDALGQPARTYTPPCNRWDRRTGRALDSAGYHQVLSERRVLNCSLPQRRSDFYGRSPDYQPARCPRTVTLHLTWEWDVRRKGGTAESLRRLMEDLQQQHRAAWEMEHRMVHAFAALKGALAS